MHIKKILLLSFTTVTLLVLNSGYVKASDNDHLNDSTSSLTNTENSSHKANITLQGRGTAQNHLDRQRTRLRQTELQPTGFFVNEGDTVVIHVSGADNGRVLASIGIPENGEITNHQLNEGRNEIVSTHSGVLNLINRNSDGDVQINIESNLDKIPFFVLGETTNEDWERMMTEYSTAPMVQLKSDRALISVRYGSAQQFIEDAKDLMDYYDRFIRAQERIAGEVEGDEGIHRINPNYYHYVEANRLYMFATHGHMGFNGDGALSRLLKTNNGWGPWHETGHLKQQAPWTWTAVVEATVNIYSLAAQEEITGSANWLDNQWPGVREYLVTNNKVYNNQSNEIKLAMFWQLHLTFGEEFYPRLHRRYREFDERLVPSSDAQRQQSFIIETSNISQINLIPFFEMWGFPIEQNTQNQLSHLPVLDQSIWENETSDHITIELPDEEIELPGYEYVLPDMIKDVRLVGNQFQVDIDREAQEGSNRIIFDVNGSYVAESFEGTAYTSRILIRTDDTVTIGLNNQVTVGDTLRIRLSSGRPGQASNMIEHITITVTPDGLEWSEINN